MYKRQNLNIWCSSETTLPNDKTKEEFDKNPVLERFNHQLQSSGIETKHTMSPDFSWSCVGIEKIMNEYKLSNYILLFPFCSPHLTLKKWPYFNNLINLIKAKYKDQYKIITAPGPKEINEADQYDAIKILDNGKALSISQLSTLIKKNYNGQIPGGYSQGNKEKEIKEIVKMVEGKLPTKKLKAVPQSKTSDNKKLNVVCSYCEYKSSCRDNLRTFIYSYGPEYLVEVNTEPKVPEIFHD